MSEGDNNSTKRRVVAVARRVVAAARRVVVVARRVVVVAWPIDELLSSLAYPPTLDRSPHLEREHVPYKF